MITPPDREPTKTTQIQLMPVSLLLVPYRNVSDGLLTGPCVTQRQLCHKTPPSHGCQLTKSAQCADNLTGWSVSSRQLGWFLPFPISFAG